MPKTEAERVQFLADLGVADKGKTLGVAKPAASKSGEGPKLAPEGVDPHTMPVTDIVFDPALLDGFTSLEGRAPADHVFALYKTPTKNKDRNSLLWSRIGKFVEEVRLQRSTGGHVKEKVKTSADERALAQLLATHNITAADLAKYIEEHEKED